jgi:predicted phosphodiesterase
MRFGVISDIHGNLEALEAAIAVLSAENVDEYLCAGDLVGYGPKPNECVARVAELQAQCVAGNHDLMALGVLSDDRCSQLARETMRWTQSVLTADSRDYLGRLPSVLAPESGPVVAHGSLEDPSKYVRTDGQRAAELRLLADGFPEARVLILGHTHARAAHGSVQGTLRTRFRRSLALADGERYVLNPGSVGQSRDLMARSRFMLLDLPRGFVRFYGARYDIRACQRALQGHGLPVSSVHPKPPVRQIGASWVRSGIRRAARR